MHEIRSLTGIRGIASLYVVGFHYTLGLTFITAASTFVAHGYLAVDLFFVLSGFVMALTYTRMFEAGWSVRIHLRFLGRRLARVYPLYVVTTLVAAILTFYAILDLPTDTSVGVALGYNLVMAQSWGLTQSLNPPAWSISAEWAAYLLFPLLLMPCLLRSWTVAWVVAACCVVILAMLTQVTTAWEIRANPDAILDVSDPFLALPTLRCLAEFCLGLITFRAARSPIGAAVTRWRWTAALIAPVLLVLLFIPKADLAVVLLCPPLILALSGERQTLSRVLGCNPLEFLGRLSYSIYLIHYLMLPLVGWLHAWAGERQIAHAQTLGAGVALTLTFGLAFVAYWLIEVPARNWLRHVLEGAPRLRVA